MKILLQSKRTRDYVECGGGWTWKRGRARVFRNGLEAIMFCFNHHMGGMQIVGAFRNMAKNFNVPVTDSRGNWPLGVPMRTVLAAKFDMSATGSGGN